MKILLFLSLIGSSFCAEKEMTPAFLQGKLPFSYISSQYLKKDQVFIPESGFSLINEEDNSKIYIVGPLNPCILVGFKKGSQTLLFHKYMSNSLEKMEEIVNKFLEKDHSSTQLYIFGTKVFEKEEEEKSRKINNVIKQSISVCQSDFDGGRVVATVREDIKRIKTFFSTRLNLKPENIKAQQYLLSQKTSEGEGYLNYRNKELGEYSFSELFVAYVPSKGSSLSSCLFSIDAERDGKDVALKKWCFEERIDPFVKEEIKKWQSTPELYVKFDFATFYSA